MFAKKMAVLATLLAVTAGAYADSPQINFSVEATVPSSEFYVTPVNGWDAQVQKMAWNPANNALDSISQQLQMKNTSGGIKAYLSGQPVLSSSSGTDVIELQVAIANQQLPITSSAAVTLFDEAAAKTEKTVTMMLSQKSGVKPEGGTYMGAVTMMFDTVMP